MSALGSGSRGVGRDRAVGAAVRCAAAVPVGVDVRTAGRRGADEQVDGTGRLGEARNSERYNRHHASYEHHVKQTLLH